jgi:fumarate hydratase class II
VLAVSLTKIANDIRLLGSGPACGLGELRLPENEPGSSIMPGKVNPPGRDADHGGGAGDGQSCRSHHRRAPGPYGIERLQALIGANVLRSIDLLATGMESFTERALDGLEPDRRRIEELMNRSLMLVTALAPEIGYDQAAKIAKYAHEHG